MVDINEVNPGHVLFEIANCGNGGYKILEFHIKEVHSYQDSNESYMVEAGGDSLGNCSLHKMYSTEKECARAITDLVSEEIQTRMNWLLELSKKHGSTHNPLAEKYVRFQSRKTNLPRVSSVKDE